MKDPAIAHWAREQQDWLAAQREIIFNYPLADPVLRKLAIILEHEGNALHETLVLIERTASV